jgi:hypothetical protein
MSLIINNITAELESAKDKYPDWPVDIIHQVSIMNEEAGESIRAALNHVYHNEPIEELEGELIQTAAMCIRCLEAIYEKRR